MYILLSSPMQGLLLELHDAQTGITTKLRIAINFSHACIELREPVAEPTGAVSRCLRSITSLDEALVALHARTGRAMATPSSASAGDGRASSSSPSGGGTVDTLSPLRQQSAARRQQFLAFQSPAKPPIKVGTSMESVREGIRLVRICSSAMLREGTALLHAAASNPVSAAAAIEQGAMEALVTAAASVLPSGVMGGTEQLTMFTLCASSLLDGAIGQPCRGAARTVSALASALQHSAANPLLLCKLLVALLQRPDVKLEALEQGLVQTISETYLRKSPLLEPLAKALLSSPRLGGTSRSTNSLSTPINQEGRTCSGLKDLASGAGSSRGRDSSSHYDGLGNGRSARTSTDSSEQSQDHQQQLGGRMEWQPSSSLSLGKSNKLSIPRLALPEDTSNVAPVLSPTGGFTRATRRSSTTPGMCFTLYPSFFTVIFYES